MSSSLTTPFSCGSSVSYSGLEFQPIFNTGLGGIVSNYTGNYTYAGNNTGYDALPVCNVDPSQSNFFFSIAITGEFCDLPEDDVYFAAAYTGAADGLVTSVTATTTLPPTVTSSIIIIYTGLPYSAVSNGGEVLLTAFNNVYTSSTATEFACASNIGGGSFVPFGPMTTLTTTSTDYYTNVFSMIQTYVPTLVYVDATQTLSYTTTPTTVTTSTITQTGLSVAPAVTSTATTSAGTATIEALPVTTVTTFTITRQNITHTKHEIARTTTSILCIPAAANQAAQVARRQENRYRLRNLLQRRVDPISNSTIAITTAEAATYITGNCAPISFTTFTTGTVFANNTVTAPIVTNTAFAITSTVSTYTPTNTVFTDAVSTVTITPTLTRQTISIIRRKTFQVTETRTKTRTIYPKHPPKCAQPTMD